MDIQPYLPYLGFIGAAIAWFYEKKKRKATERLTIAKASSTELDTVEKAIAIWRSLAKEFQDEVSKLRSTVEEFSLENEKLRLEVEDLRLENEKLRHEVKGLREELKKSSDGNKI